MIKQLVVWFNKPVWINMCTHSGQDEHHYWFCHHILHDSSFRKGAAI